MTRLFARPPCRPGALALCALFACFGCDSRTRVLVNTDSTPPDAFPDMTADSRTDAMSDARPDASLAGWTAIPLSVTGDVYAIWASDDGTRVWAAGRRAPMSPVLWRFDGERFIDATPPELRSMQNSSLHNLWGTADGKLWTSNREATFPPWHFDGTSWRATTGMPSTEYLHQIRGYGDAVWAAGRSSSGALVAHWDGSAWVAQKVSGVEVEDVVPLDASGALGIGHHYAGPSSHGGLWRLPAGTSDATNATPTFRRGCALPNNDVLLLGHPSEAKDWMRWSASDGLLPLSGNVVPLVRQTESCWGGHAFVVADGQVLQIDSAQSQVIGNAPSPAVLGPHGSMAVSRTDIWVAGKSIHEIWRLRRSAP